jgi:hypothetical protein
MENVDASNEKISTGPFLTKDKRSWMEQMMEEVDDQQSELDPWRLSRNNNQDFGHLYKKAHGYGAWRRQIALGRNRSAGDIVNSGYYDRDVEKEIPQAFGVLRPKDRSVSTKNTASSGGNTTLDDSTAYNDCSSSAIEESLDPSEAWEDQVEAYGILIEDDDGVSQLSDEVTRASIPEEDRLLQETFVAPFAFLQHAIEFSLTNCGVPSACDCGEAAGDVKPQEDPSSSKRDAVEDDHNGVLSDLLPHIQQVMDTPFHPEPEPIRNDVRSAEHRLPLGHAKKENETSNVFLRALNSIHDFFCGSNDGPMEQDPAATSPWDLGPSEQTITDAIKMGMAVTAGSYRYAIDETNSLIDDFVGDHVHYFHDCVDTTVRAQAAAPLMQTQRGAKRGTSRELEHGARWKYETPLPTEAGMSEIAECFSDTSLILMADLEGKIQNIRETVNTVVEANINFPLRILQNVEEIEGIPTDRTLNGQDDVNNDQALGEKSRRADDEISDPDNYNKRHKIEFAPFRYMREAVENTIPRINPANIVSDGGAIVQARKWQQETVTASNPRIDTDVEASSRSFSTSSDGRVAHNIEAQRLTRLINRAFKANDDPDVLDIVCDYSERFVCGEELERLTNGPNAVFNIPGDKGSEKGNKDYTTGDASKPDGESMLEKVHTQMDGLKQAIGASKALNDFKTRLQSFHRTVQKPALTLPDEVDVDKVPPKSQDAQVTMASLQLLIEQLQSDRNPFMQTRIERQEPTTMQTLSPDPSFQEPLPDHSMLEPFSSADIHQKCSSGVLEDSVIELLHIGEDPHNPRFEGRRIIATPPVYRPKGMLRKLKAAMQKNDGIVDKDNRVQPSEGRVWTVSPRAPKERKVAFGQSTEEGPEDNRDAAHSIPAGRQPSKVERDGRDESNVGQPTITDNSRRKKVVAKTKPTPFDGRGDKKKLAVVRGARFTKIVDTNHKMIENRVSVDAKHSRQGVFVSSRINTLNSRKNVSYPLKKSDTFDQRQSDQYLAEILDMQQDGRDASTNSPVNVHRGRAITGRKHGVGNGDSSSTSRLGKQRSTLSTESKEKPSSSSSITKVQDVLQRRNEASQVPPTSGLLPRPHPAWTRVTTSLQQGDGEIDDETTTVMTQKSNEARLGINPFVPQHKQLVMLHSTRRHTPVVDVPLRGEQGIVPLSNNNDTTTTNKNNSNNHHQTAATTLDWTTPVSIPSLERQQSLTHQAVAQLTRSNTHDTTKTLPFQSKEELWAPNNYNHKKQQRQTRKGIFGLLLRTVVCKPRHETKTPKME